MTKIICESVTLPAHWASALINGDYTGLDAIEYKQVIDWVRKNAHLSIVSCDDYPEHTFFEGQMCECLTYQAHVTYTAKRSNGLEYLIYPFTLFDVPAPRTGGTRTGYGPRIPTSKCLYLEGRRYRVYCRVWSNAGTSYINYHGRQVIVE